MPPDSVKKSLNSTMASASTALAQVATVQKKGLVDPRIIEEEIPEKKKGAGTMRIKKPAPKQSKPGNWKDNDIAGFEKKDTDENDPPSPLINPIHPSIAAAFPTNRPFEDNPERGQCKHCRKPLVLALAGDHVKNCLKIKQEKLKKKKEAKEAKAREKDGRASLNANDADSIAGDASGSKGKGARKSATKAALDGDDDGTAKKTKKRKADGDPSSSTAVGGSGGPPSSKKKKKEEQAKAKTAKPKGPVDVEKQCGVPLANGALCARSLTCKSHPMGAKRSVPGRSLPYDMLLAQYQKKNQAKQQRAAIDANAPIPDELEQSGPVDSEEEKEAVMSAIARARPRAIVAQPPISAADTRMKYQYVRMKEMLGNALGGSLARQNTAGGAGGGGGGGTTASTPVIGAGSGGGTAGFFGSTAFRRPNLFTVNASVDTTTSSSAATAARGLYSASLASDAGTTPVTGRFSANSLHLSTGLGSAQGQGQQGMGSAFNDATFASPLASAGLGLDESGFDGGGGGAGGGGGGGHAGHARKASGVGVGVGRKASLGQHASATAVAAAQ